MAALPLLILRHGLQPGRPAETQVSSPRAAACLASADALWDTIDRKFGPNIEHMMSSFACRPDASMRIYLRHQLLEGDGPALRAEMRRLGLDEA